MVRSAIVGLVAVLLIAKVATGLRFIMPNSVERTETKEFSPGHTKTFDVHAENGSIEIVGQNDASANIEITSVLQASAHDEEAAAAALDAMEVTIEGMDPGQEKETCRVGWRWKTPPQIDWSGSVRFKILAPEKVNVECDAQNGAVTVTNLSGTAKLKSQNGKIVSDTSGKSLEARTDNGVIDAKYTGPHLQLHAQNGTISADLSHARAVDGDITTQNGAVSLTVGDDTSCKLAASTVNGRVLMPNHKRGWLKRLMKSRSIHETLGTGGGTLKLAVQNGVIKVKHVKAESDSDSDDEDSDD
jgi:Putative adhesin